MEEAVSVEFSYEKTIVGSGYPRFHPCFTGATGLTLFRIFYSCRDAYEEPKTATAKNF
jgi:hypothetical protein